MRGFMKCTICGKKIVLVPSAQERAKNSDKPASYYTKLFTTHSSCSIKKREEETLELIRRIKAEKENERAHVHNKILG